MNNQKIKIMSRYVDFIKYWKSKYNNVRLAMTPNPSCEEAIEWADEHPINDWQPIERDKSGFATEECLNTIFKNLPIEVYDYMDLGDEGEFEDIHYIDSDNAPYWRSYIKLKLKYTHWRKFNAPSK